MLTRTQIVEFYNLYIQIAVFTAIFLFVFFCIKLYLRENKKFKQLLKSPSFKSVKSFQELPKFRSFPIRIQRIVEGLLLLSFSYIIVNTFVQVIPFHEIESLYIQVTIVEITNTIEGSIYNIFSEKSFTGTVAVGGLLIASLCFILSSLIPKLRHTGRFFVISTLLFLFWKITDASSTIIDVEPEIYDLYLLDFTTHYLRSVLFSIPWYFGTFCLIGAGIIFLLFIISRIKVIFLFIKKPAKCTFKSIFTTTTWKKTKNRISYLIFPPFFGAILSFAFMENNPFYLNFYNQNSALECILDIENYTSYLKNSCLNIYMNGTILMYGLIILGFSGIWKWLRPMGWTIVAIIFPLLTLLKTLDIKFF